METPEEIKSRKGKLTEAEVNTLKSCVTIIEGMIKETSISYNSMKEVNNLHSMIRIFNEAYTERVINLLREGTRLN